MEEHRSGANRHPGVEVARGDPRRARPGESGRAEDRRRGRRAARAAGASAILGSPSSWRSSSSASGRHVGGMSPEQLEFYESLGFELRPAPERRTRPTRRPCSGRRTRSSR
jgi:hypothetical protein